VADSTILREYLIALGFKVDDAQYRKIENTIKKTVETIGTIGEGVAVAAALVDKYVVQMAGKFDDLYYASQQMSSSVKNLQTYSFAARMVGIDGNAAAAGLANMARAIRQNPLLQGRLQQLGVKVTGDVAEEQNQLIHKLAKLPRNRAIQVASNFGIDGDTLNQILNNLPAYDAAAAERKRMFDKSGINPQDVANSSAAFERDMTRLDEHIEVLKTILLIKFLPAIDKLVTALSKGADWLSAHPNTTAFGGVAGAILGSIGLKKMAGYLLRSAGKELGLRGAAGAGEAALGETAIAGEGAAAVGVAGLAEIIIPVVLAVLAALGLYWLFTHKDQVGGIIKKIADKAKPVEKALENFNKQGDAKIAGFAGSAMSGLKGFIDKWEVGQSKDGLFRAYGSIEGGSATIGHGHKIKPGEHFDHPLTAAEADALEAKDIAAAAAAVARMTKGMNLSPGWMAALTDFQFNTRKGLAGAPTLMKHLRAGNLDAAAGDFSLYAGYRDKHGIWHNPGTDKVSSSLLDRRLGDAAMARGTMIQQKTDIHVNGASDPASVGRHVLNGQKQTNADLARNVAAAAGAY